MLSSYPMHSYAAQTESGPDPLRLAQTPAAGSPHDGPAQVHRAGSSAVTKNLQAGSASPAAKPFSYRVCLLARLAGNGCFHPPRGNGLESHCGLALQECVSSSWVTYTWPTHRGLQPSITWAYLIDSILHKYPGTSGSLLLCGSLVGGHTDRHIACSQCWTSALHNFEALNPCRGQHSWRSPDSRYAKAAQHLGRNKNPPDP
jgi:hypothetical protein